MAVSVPARFSAIASSAAAAWAGFRQTRLGRRLAPLIDWLRRVGLIAAPNRFVLTIGDEGATLVQFRGRHAIDAVFVGPEAEDGLDTLRGYLAADKDASVLVSADVLEQMYREETLPKAGRFDRASMVRRRLDLAFPHDRLRAALPLSREKGAGETMLFTALPVSSALENWIAFLEGLANPVIGFSLLPLEAVGIASRLAPPEQGDGRRVWRALVSQQATSGFRQVFDSGNNLVVTRLTQRPPGDLTAEATALLIERELRSSISYIKRLGYTEFDCLDLVVLADSEVCGTVSERNLPVASVTALTPRQAAERLGFEPVGPEDSPYADVLHAQVLAARRKPRAFLPTEAMSQRLKNRAAFKVGFVAAAALTLAALLSIGAIAFDFFDVASSIELMRQQLATEQQSLDASRKRLQSFPIPIGDLLQVERTESALVKDEINPTSLLRSLAAVVDQTVTVQKVSFVTPAQPATAAPTPPRGGARPPPAALYEIHLTVRFYGDAQPDAVVQQARDLKDRLVKLLPGHEVTVVRLPTSQWRSQVLEGSAGAAPAAAVAGPPSAEYLIRKGA
jgi:hypothetical protein